MIKTLDKLGTEKNFFQTDKERLPKKSPIVATFNSEKLYPLALRPSTSQEYLSSILFQHYSEVLASTIRQEKE